MKTRKIFRTKSFQLHQRDGQGIAHHHLGRGAAGGGQVMPAGFFRNGGIQKDIRFFGELGMFVAGHADQRVPVAVQQRHKHFDLRAFTAFADEHHHIVVGDHAEVAVNGVSGMHVGGGSAGGIEGGHDLLRHDGAFPNAADYDPAPGSDDNLYGAYKFAVDKTFQSCNGSGFFTDDP